MDKYPVTPTTFEGLMVRAMQRVDWYIRNGRTSKAKLARKAGVSTVHMHRMLNGHSGFSAKVADAMLGALGISLLDLLSREERRRVIVRDERIRALARLPKLQI